MPFVGSTLSSATEVAPVMEQDSGPVLLVTKGSRPLRGEALRGSSECPQDDAVLGTLWGLAFSLAPRPKHTSCSHTLQEACGPWPTHSSDPARPLVPGPLTALFCQREEVITVPHAGGVFPASEIQVGDPFTAFPPALHQELRSF